MGGARRPRADRQRPVFSNLPYSLYTNADFWTNSPALVWIRLGLMLVALAGAYLWTELVSGGWSWVQILGRNSLMVYWVHVVLVYGFVLERWKARLSIAETAALTVAITALMLALSVARLRWKLTPAAHGSLRLPSG